MTFDLAALQYEAEWLTRWPEFEERPASIAEFIGPGYLDIEARIRPALRQVLIDLFGDEVRGDHMATYSRGISTGGIGIGKGHPVGTPILTPKGFVSIENLAVGDEVIGSDGKSTALTGVFYRGTLPLYRVSFIDKTSVLVDGDHIWRVDRLSRDLWEDIDTRTLASRVLCSGGRTYHPYEIPVVLPVEFSGSGEELPLPPYVLGALLGDGCFSKSTASVTLAGIDFDIADRFEAELPGIEMKRHDACMNWILKSTTRPHPIKAVLAQLGLLGLKGQQKFIPETYMRASVEDRLDFLRGLMDTDGSIDASGQGTVFYQHSESLALQVVDLVRSLGGIARIRPQPRPTGTEYQVRVNLGEMCPFWLPRKVARWKPMRVRRSITSARADGEGEVICLQVAAKDQLYVTQDYIVTHNTTLASIMLPYMAHWVLCLRDPQAFFNLMPGSRIAFMQMSTSEKQAVEVVYGDIKARIEHSEWFKRYPWDSNFTKQLRFPKDVWILPGDSEATSFEGYNLLGGILDEADSHKVTATRDYAEIGYDTIANRIDSRFGDRGLLLVIGQMKHASGFAKRKYDEFRKRDDAYSSRMTIWESFGLTNDIYRCKKCGEFHTFSFDTHRKEIITEELAAVLGIDRDNVIQIPVLYQREFETNPEKALRDLAGIPPAVGDPFISQVYKIDEARQRWIDRHGREDGPVNLEGIIADWFKASDTVPRVAHLDIAYAADGDALGFAMGHVHGVIDIDGELKPYIIMDLLYRKKAPAGGEIYLSDIRHTIYSLKSNNGFKLKRVTYDTFQSTDTKQQLRKKGFEVAEVSVDRTLVPYYDLRDALYEDRIEFPPYEVMLEPGSAERVEIAVKELSQLVDAGKKIDHPASGSKDVADCMAGVVFTLMGDRAYRRNVVSLDAARQERVAVNGGLWRPQHPAYNGDMRLRAPLVPNRSR